MCTSRRCRDDVDVTSYLCPCLGCYTILTQLYICYYYFYATMYPAFMAARVSGPGCDGWSITDQGSASVHLRSPLRCRSVIHNIHIYIYIILYIYIYIYTMPYRTERAGRSLAGGSYRACWKGERERERWEFKSNFYRGLVDHQLVYWLCLSSCLQPCSTNL